MIISRRSLVVAGGTFLCIRPSWAEPGAAASAKVSLMATPPAKVLGFDVVRDKSKIGTHVLTFDQAGDNLIVNVAVELKVGVGPITLFRYTHHATEVWKNGQLFSLDTESDDDGKPNIVTGRRTETGFMVEGTKAPLYTAPDNAIPATHWNRHMLDGPMINTQDGRLMHPTITPMGNDAIPVAAGGTIMADRFALSGDAVLDTWYDSTPSWAGLSFKAGDGSLIIYERV
ncbi:MAG: hypothetical protein JWM91_1591 [Rhodospirillales bacterium]|nr:hypothetical protein [Rhodospirillales bacterium]